MTEPKKPRHPASKPAAPENPFNAEPYLREKGIDPKCARIVEESGKMPKVSTVGKETPGAAHDAVLSEICPPQLPGPASSPRRR